MEGEGTVSFIDIFPALLLSPMFSIFLKFGSEVQLEFWVCLLLILFGYIPDIIYTIYATTK